MLCKPHNGTMILLAECVCGRKATGYVAQGRDVLYTTAAHPDGCCSLDHQPAYGDPYDAATFAAEMNALHFNRVDRHEYVSGDPDVDYNG